MDVIPACPICKSAEESLEHVFFSCPFTQNCWEATRLNVQCTTGLSVGQRFLKLFTSLTNQEIEMLCMVAWSIWNHRNTVVWRNRYQTPSVVVNGASTLLFQWEKAQNKKNNMCITNQQEGRMIWQKPIAGWVTCNVDAGVYKQKNLSSFGCLVRDEHGMFVAGYGGQFVGIIDPKIAEAMAFREALSWLKKIEVTNVVTELDALTVVQAVRRRNVEDLSYFGSIILDCSTILKHLRSCSVFFVKRTANIAAHTIAREASSMFDQQEWFSVPSFLVDVLDHDNL